jgi:hypothetical protein
MVIAEIRSFGLSDWRGQLRDTATRRKIGREWQADQRGALIGLIMSDVPVPGLKFVDALDPPLD